MAKSIKVVIDYVEKHGFVLARQGNHYVFKNDDRTLCVSKTPRCGVGLQLNCIKTDLRRMGITPLPI
jgi:predicted RNA binding protein YcfA (HicA-like mRNA interferase family)